MRAFVAFDLDGVLYRAEPFLGEAYRAAIASVNARHPGALPRVPTTAEILAHVGWPVPVILARLFPGTASVAIDLLYAETLEHICRHVAAGDGALFPGVSGTLAQLHAAGCVLAIASNGRPRYIATVLDTYGLRESFVDVVAIDREQIVDKAGILRAYMARHAVPATHMVMVGDRASDVEAAAAVGCPFVGCDYGYGHRDEIAGAGPLVQAFTELPPVIARVLDGEGSWWG